MGSDIAGDIRARIASDWSEAPHYDEAEAWTDVFWAPDSPFRRRFELLDLTDVAELACGRGRHAAQCVERCGTLTLVDVNQTNIEACRRRFAGNPKVRLARTGGNELFGCATGSMSALYCYDTMVHFEMLDVFDYLRETARVLRPGGRALLHVSNNDATPGQFYQDNTHWRNFGSAAMFRHAATRLGFRVLDWELLDWAGAPQIDALLLIERA